MERRGGERLMELEVRARRKDERGELSGAAKLLLRSRNLDSVQLK